MCNGSTLSPVLPAAVKNSPWLVYALVMIVYVPISSNWLGFERAKAITSGSSKHTVNVTIDEKVQGSLGLVGRLGDSYVLWTRTESCSSCASGRRE